MRIEGIKFRLGKFLEAAGRAMMHEPSPVGMLRLEHFAPKDFRVEYCQGGEMTVTLEADGAAMVTDVRCEAPDQTLVLHQMIVTEIRVKARLVPVSKDAIVKWFSWEETQPVKPDRVLVDRGME